MTFKNILLAMTLSCAGLTQTQAANSFAIVVDPITYEKVKSDIDSYAHAIHDKEGLNPVVVIDRWGVPDSIRAQLMRLYKQKTEPIEGAVFIGDIPIPMVRDAQHLTSAFKMNQQTFEWQVSSVPTDRFYDDFDLQFDFLKRDDNEPAYFYYSLSPESAQRLSPELYSGRIKANDDTISSRYEKISRFLKKAVVQKYIYNQADQILFFSGNGYVSESVTARIDEKVALFENFPWLKRHKNGIEYIDHRRDKAIKTRLKTEMQRPDLDIAVLHHHGDVEIQYMNGIPLPQSTDEEIENVKLYLRESLRHAREKGKDVDSVKARLNKRFGELPEKWYDGAFEPLTMRKDSLFMRSLDLFIDEFDTYRPNARLVILDACFNGSFHKDKYIAGAYIFNRGNTVAVLANSVNVLQDKWHDRYLGMAGLGMRAGRLSQLNPYLESHCFGDPTFHFCAPDAGFDVNKALAEKKESFWEQHLSDSYPAVRAMALRQLFESGKNYSNLLLDTFRKSDSFVERMEAMVLLASYADDNFIECLRMAVDDSFELIQRFAINYMAKSGDPRLAPALIQVAVRNNTSERCEFNTKLAMSLFPESMLMPEFEKQFKAIPYYSDKQQVHDAIAHAISVNTKKWTDDVNLICNDSIKTKKKMSAIRTLRNYTLHDQVPKLLECLSHSHMNTEAQIALWEALGWFELSYQRSLIAEKALQTSNDMRFPEAVRDEALKTYHRLTTRNRQ